jgi:hypothetical protein
VTSGGWQVHTPRLRPRNAIADGLARKGFALVATTSTLLDARTQAKCNQFLKKMLGGRIKWLMR